MDFGELVPWHWGRKSAHPVRNGEHPLMALHREVDRLFDDLWQGGGAPASLAEAGRRGPIMPRIDESEDDAAYHIMAEMPGMAEEDLEVSIANGLLTIRGNQKADETQEKKNYYRRERAFGEFRRVVPLPADVDEAGIKASFANGVLTIDLPKTAQARKKSRSIAIASR